jgi:molecular chaperone GrpE
VAEVFRRKAAEPVEQQQVVVDDGSGGWVAYADVEPHLDELERLQGERVALIDLCLYARDRVSSQAAAERIDAGLAGLGIVPLRPDGQPFDPGQHEAAATVPTQDPGLHGRVAETEVVGYADNGVLVRPAVVSVYQAGP